MINLSSLRCPSCNHKLNKQKNKFICKNCNEQYEIKHRIPIFKEKKEKEKTEKTTPKYWEKVWQQNDIKKHLYSSRKRISFYLKLTKMFQKITRDLSEKKDVSIMELGCGGSQFLPYFLETLNPKYISGIDRSYAGCKLTLNAIPEEEATIVCSDIFSHPFKNKIFDFVYSFTLIHHFLNPKKILEIHTQLLKPGGILLCIVPNLQGVPQKFFDLLNVDTMVKISTNDMKTWLKELGFRDITVKPVGGLHPILMLIQSYRPPSNSLNEEMLFFFYKYILNIPLLILNLPLLFRLNKIQLSPFIMAMATKK